MFDMSQLARSREYSSMEELNLEMQRLTGAGPIPAAIRSDRPSKAQRLVYDAWNAPDGSGSVALARKALLLDPDCADAHLFLALHPEDSEGMLKHAFEAVNAGRRTLDKVSDRAPDDGQLWGFLPARPYLRARVFLARCLWVLGGRLAAIDLLHETLELDEGDALGVRYLLLGRLLGIGELMITRELLDTYKKEHSTFLLYADALLSYLEGDERAAKTKLKRAIKANPHVPELLLSSSVCGDEVAEIEVYAAGSEEEAAICAFLLDTAWRADDAAIDWLDDTVAPPGRG